MAPRKATKASKQGRISDSFAISKHKDTVCKAKSNVLPVKIEEQGITTKEPKPAVPIVEKEQLPQLDEEKNEYKRVLSELTASNISKPIHQQNISSAEKLLKQFDMKMEYGPTVGISRLDRWDRAERLGLNPPPAVREILHTSQGITEPRLRDSYAAEYL